MAGLTQKVFLQSALFLGFVGALLFVPAGSLRYWQGWTYYSIFCLSILLLDVYLLRRDPALLARRMKMGEVGEQEARQRMIQKLSGLSCLLLLLIPGFDHRFHWSEVPTFLVVTANVLVMMGFLLVFFVFKENSYASSIIEVDQGQRVISTGPYRLVRHPLYAAALLLFLCTPLALGSYWALLVVPPLTALLVLRLLDEERVLSLQLLGYEAYCQQTRRRLLPFIW